MRIDLDGTNAPCNEFDENSLFGPPEEPMGLELLPSGVDPAFGASGSIYFSKLGEDTLTNPGALLVGEFSGVQAECFSASNTIQGPNVLGTVPSVFPTGVAIGDFNGSGEFGVYFTWNAPEIPGALPREHKILRLVCCMGAALFVEEFADLSEEFTDDTSRIKALEFDPFSGFLFATEGSNSDDSTPSRIWRIGSNGTVEQFGEGFKNPQGISFLSTGVMLVSESDSDGQEGTVLVVDGWRNEFKRGDVDGSGLIDITDPITLLNFLNFGDPPVTCFDAADFDDSGKLDNTDAINSLDWQFNGNNPPGFPGPNCGRDPTPDFIGCLNYPADPDGCAANPIGN